jgi:L-cysteine S-thiosulfotransferase
MAKMRLIRFLPAFCLAAAIASGVTSCVQTGAVTTSAAQTDNRRSGTEYMSAENQALERDDTQNPAMLWVKDGEAHWSRKEGAAQKSCADCHDAAEKSMRGVAARYPAFDVASSKPINLQQRIDICRTKNQRATTLAPESQQILNLESFVALQSRGVPIAPPNDTRLNDARARGKALYQQRIGQLDLACTHCHDRHAGGKLGGGTIPQAHPTAYPLYRLEWQSVGGLQRRLRNCMSGVRAEPYALGSAELVELELYLAERAARMKWEAPGLRP